VITTRVQVVAVFVVLMTFGWWVTAQPPFSASGTIGVLAAGLVLIAAGRSWRHNRASDAAAASEERWPWIWLVVVGLIVAWELISFVSHPREAHPTVSSMTDSLQAEHAVRWLFFGGWLGFGWVLAT
jgi:hypothetical protein